MTSKSLMHSLTEGELLLVRETERTALSGLDEDDLSALHDRVRRARGKYVKQYRRGASARVATSGGRGKAAPKNRRAADKAEVFEDALARVSTALAAAARRSAAELKAERLDAARSSRSGAVAAGSASPGSGDQPVARTKRVATKTPVSQKKRASSQSAGARRQAKRDARLARQAPQARSG